MKSASGDCTNRKQQGSQRETRAGYAGWQRRGNLDQGTPGGDTFADNAASENPSLLDIAKAAKAAVPAQVAINHLHTEMEPPVLRVSSDKLLEETGFSPRISLEQGMIELYIALKGQRTEPSLTTNTENVYARKPGNGSRKVSS